ncbi:MAG: GIDE domain-containing protein [Candidatus Sulfotelmatobacter sp.]
MILSTLAVHSADPIRLIVWCAIGLCAGLYLFFNGFRVLQRRHLILDTPISKIRSASMGVVELSGLAVGPYTLIAPVTERPCYYFRTLVWEWKRRGRSKRWVKVAVECMHVPFFLDDNTGKVMIDPRGAELDLHRDFQREYCDSFFTTKEEVPANVRALLARHGVNTTNKIKVEEFCIKPKNALFLLGTLGENPGLELNPQPIQDDENNTLTFGRSLWVNPAQSELGRKVLSFTTGRADDTPSEQRSVSEMLIGAGSYSKPDLREPRFQQSDAYDKTLSDFSSQIQVSPDPPSPKAANTAEDQKDEQKMAAILMAAGISNPSAWAAAGVTASTPTGIAKNPSNLNAPGPVDGFDKRPSVVLKKGKNIPILLISWRSQREIARSLGWKSGLMIWGGPALALLCLYGLLALTHVI